MKKPKQQYVSIAQFAEKMGVSRQRVLMWITAGRLDADRVGRGYQIAADAKRPKKMPPGRASSAAKAANLAHFAKRQAAAQKKAEAAANKAAKQAAKKPAKKAAKK